MIEFILQILPSVFLNAFEYVHNRVVLNVGIFCNLSHTVSKDISTVNHFNFHCICNLFILKSASPCRSSDIKHPLLIVACVWYLKLVGINIDRPIELEMEILLHIDGIIKTLAVSNQVL